MTKEDREKAEEHIRATAHTLKHSLKEYRAEHGAYFKAMLTGQIMEYLTDEETTIAVMGLKSIGDK